MAEGILYTKDAAGARSPNAGVEARLTKCLATDTADEPDGRTIVAVFCFESSRL